MEFGRDHTTDISTIDFTIPKDPPFNDSVLPGNASDDFQLYLGASKIGHKKWNGTLYPSGNQDKDNIVENAKIFNFVEFNASFYKTPPKEQLLRYVERLEGKRFLFSPKMARTVTHIKRLKNTEKELFEFIETVGTLGPHLGPTLIQLADTFDSKQPYILTAFLNLIPPTFEIKVEFRRPEWFEPVLLKDMMDILCEKGVGSVFTDTNLRRDVLHMHLTIPEAYIRFNGNSNDPTDKLRLRAWQERMKEWQQKGLKKAYLVLHQPMDEEFAETVRVAKEIFEVK